MMKSDKWIPSKAYRKIFSTVPRASVDVIVFNKRGEVLLAKRDIPPGKGKWHIPGGGITRGERVVETAIRKIKEETGLKIKPKMLVGIWDDPKRNPAWHDVTFVLTARTVGGKLRGSAEGRDVKFFNTKKLPKMMFDHNREIKLAVEKKFYMWGLKW